MLRQQDLAQLLKDACFLVADGLGGNAPVQGDLGGGLTHEGLVDQAGLAWAQGMIDGFPEGLAPRFGIRVAG